MVDVSWLQEEFAGCTQLGEAAARLGYGEPQNGNGKREHAFQDPGWYLVELKREVWYAPGSIDRLVVVEGGRTLVVRSSIGGRKWHMSAAEAAAELAKHPRQVSLTCPGYLVALVHVVER